MVLIQQWDIWLDHRWCNCTFAWLWCGKRKVRFPFSCLSNCICRATECQPVQDGLFEFVKCVEKGHPSNHYPSFCRGYSWPTLRKQLRYFLKYYQDCVKKFKCFTLPHCEMTSVRKSGVQLIITHAVYSFPKFERSAGTGTCTAQPTSTRVECEEKKLT